MQAEKYLIKTELGAEKKNRAISLVFGIGGLSLFGAGILEAVSGNPIGIMPIMLGGGLATFAFMEAGSNTRIINELESALKEL